jgi:hypothetical protein
MSDNYQQAQAGWEWSDEQHWVLQKLELAASRQPTDEQVNERLLADFDSIFMMDGERN